MSDYEPTEDELAALTLIGALAGDVEWGVTRWGVVRCSDGRCPLEVAAQTGFLNHQFAAFVLGVPCHVTRCIVAAADQLNDPLRPWLLAALRMS